MKFNLHRTIALVLGTSLFGSAYAADFTMRLSHQFPPSHQTAKNLEQFATEVKEKTAGKVEVQIFGASQLFEPKQHHKAVASGEVESAVILNVQWGKTIPEMGLTSIPFLITSAGNLKAFPNSEAAKVLDAKIEAKGVKDIAWIVDANDGLFTSAKSPLIKPEDFKGVKIRGLSKIFDAGLSAMGAAPASMPGSEVYQALQTGVIDAGFTGVEAASARKFYEVQKFGVASPLITVYDNLVVNPKWWDGLPAELREQVQAAASAAAERSVPSTDGIAEEKIKALRDKGMEVTVLNDEQIKALKDAMQPAVIKAFLEEAPDDGQKLLDRVGKL